MGTILAVGAVGGSGTRAVAQILMDLGVYMGDDVNHANDNLIFTRLFKNPAWYRNAKKEKVRKRLEAFQEYMERDQLSLRNAVELLKASLTNPVFRANRRLLKIIFGKFGGVSDVRSVWGWKEPNTQVYIDDICEIFPDLKYIHVVRHGLDMAFSKNTQQLENWGRRYGIEVDGSESDSELAYKQLSYWVKSTRDALRKGAAMGSRFLLVNHSTLCRQPDQQVRRLVQFSGIGVSKKRFVQLCQIPRAPKSLGRYRTRDLSVFDQWQIDSVEELGFEI